MRLPRDRVLLVTGGTRGIGLAVARKFLQDGARVAVLSRTKVNEPGVLSLKGDVRDPEEVRRAVEEVVGAYGSLHVLVNNAGLGHFARLEDITRTHVEEIFAINVIGVLNCIQSALPHLCRNRGQIINISSTLARATVPFSTVYAMSKHALHALTASIRIELKSRGVDVLEVAPGPTETDFASRSIVVGFSRAPQFSEGRRAPPEGIAESILRASRRGSRELWLTAKAKAFILAQHVAPAWTDRLLSRRMDRILADLGAAAGVPDPKSHS
jgi:NAD(P)-dependent dehydrogenase (short-subunit alcohol dehydrogenase family)